MSWCSTGVAMGDQFPTICIVTNTDWGLYASTSTSFKCSVCHVYQLLVELCLPCLGTMSTMVELGAKQETSWNHKGQLMYKPRSWQQMHVYVPLNSADITQLSGWHLLRC